MNLLADLQLEEERRRLVYCTRDEGYGTSANC
jgi:hypothetical protein